VPPHHWLLLLLPPVLLLLASAVAHNPCSCCLYTESSHDDTATITAITLHYTHTVCLHRNSRDRWGDATMISKITAGVALANSALVDSNVGFQLESAAIQFVDYNATSHTQALQVR
jgi:hypothetical protein